MNKLKTLKHKTSPENGGIFNKFAKRYNSVSAKFLRKSPGRATKTPPPLSTGRYDMTGFDSEDHKLEIGAPILISKTTIDADRLLEPGLRNSCLSNTSANSTVTGSGETEYYTDANSTQPSIHDIKFEFFSSTDDIPTVIDERMNQSDSAANYYSTPKQLQQQLQQQQQAPPRLKKIHSQSAHNLHKSELKLFLQKIPSLETTAKITASDLEMCYDLPRRHDRSLNLEDHPLPSTPTPKMKPGSHSDPNTPNEIMADLRSNHCQSVDSLNQLPNASIRNRTSNGTVEFNSSLEDFDLKSISFQSLDAKNLFLSIDELNEITRQINESEDFGQEIDLEYCEHRDNLKPNERRITLLKNKNTRLVNFNRKKERINTAWTGLKSWIGEERGRIKEVVQKHAAMQRVGAENGVTKKSSFESKRSSGGISCAPSMVSVAQSFAQSTAGQSTLIGTDDSDFMSSDAESIFRNNSMEISTHSKNSGNERNSLEGQNGFEELRRYIKQGSDFGKDLAAILQERVDSEQLYAKSLSKMASKLNKACREIPGTIADAWRGVANEMETRSEVHRQFSNSLIEEIVKPLKNILEAQHKARKSVESGVDKSSRILSEWRISEGKAKKTSHTAARENEKLQDAMLDVRIQRSPSIAALQHGTLGNNKNGVTAEKDMKSAEKDCVKLDNKRRKAEEAVKRADVEYYTLCIRTERARVDWEMSVLRGSTLLQNLENQRLNNMMSYVSSYLRLTSEMNPVLEGLVVRLAPQIEACNVQKDLTVVKNIRRASEGPSEQLLPDFYCEHTTLAMNRERRKHALVKLLQLVRTDIDRERRSRNGLKGITLTLNTHDNQNVTDKLYHIRSMLTYLEGSRFKLQSALLELDHKPRSTHPLASHIQITRDRTGLQQSVLKVPLWLKNDDQINCDVKDNDYEIESQSNGSCIDIKNDTLIKHFDKNLNRSKSSSEILHNIQKSPSLHLNGKVSTLPQTKDTDSLEFDRGIADGGSNQPDSDFDEFSSQDDEDEIRPTTKFDEQIKQHHLAVDNNNPNDKSSIVLSKCKALYSYTPKLYDELELNPGDIIEVHMKQDDGWWLGQLKNRIGIFPATYVEEYI